jgi:hypothetical protein
MFGHRGHDEIATCGARAAKKKLRRFLRDLMGAA